MKLITTLILICTASILALLIHQHISAQEAEKAAAERHSAEAFHKGGLDEFKAKLAAEKAAYDEAEKKRRAAASEQQAELEHAAAVKRLKGL